MPHGRTLQCFGSNVLADADSDGRLWQIGRTATEFTNLSPTCLIMSVTVSNQTNFMRSRWFRAATVCMCGMNDFVILGRRPNTVMGYDRLGKHRPARRIFLFKCVHTKHTHAPLCAFGYWPRFHVFTSAISQGDIVTCCYFQNLSKDWQGLSRITND